MMRRLSLLLHTVRHLRPIQVYWRFWLKLAARRAMPTDCGGLALRSDFRLQPGAPRVRSYLGGNRFVFLNAQKDFGAQIAWNAPDLAKLWLYNLHYFDYLRQPRLSVEEGVALMEAWCRENPVGQGNGWEPYPLSLRIVNWIKFAVGGAGGLPEPAVRSLYLQCRALRRHLEFHLLGNHLFKNAVALIMAGGFFEGTEAAEWLRTGRRILREQMREQILSDGGHFECSPMYHAIMFEDVLDCLNALRGVNELAPDPSIAAEIAELEATSGRMRGFLEDILHPDGEIPFFNDAAIGIASPPAALFEFADRLGVSAQAAGGRPGPGAWAKPDFGLYRIDNGAGRLLIDAGPIGPDYLPGHAHCDTLSFELSIGGRRALVNAGTYEYAGTLRNDFRGTRSHNTLVLDGAEQHEIWSTFRVARRGYPVGLELAQDTDGWRFKAGHTGYCRLPGKPVHRREVRVTEKTWMFEDRVEGSGARRAEVLLHLHPDVMIEERSATCFRCRIGDRGFRINAGEGFSLREETYRFSPEFGLLLDGVALVLEQAGELPLGLSYSVEAD